MKRPRKRVEQLGYVEGPKDGSYFLRYWSEPDAEGDRTRKSIEIGAKNQFSSRQEANLSMEAATLRRRINAGILGKTMGQLIAQFESSAMPSRSNTIRATMWCLRLCREQWAEDLIADLALPTQSQRIKGWLDGLQSAGAVPKPLRLQSKIRVSAQMSNLFNFAMRRGWIPSTINPMKFVRLKKDLEDPPSRVLTVDQMWAFLDRPDLPKHVKVMAQVARLTGLRISEILGLQDEDFDLDEMTLAVQRRIDNRNIDRPKSKKSSEPIPVPKELYDILCDWLKSEEFVHTPEQWFFASPFTNFPWNANQLRDSWLTPWGREHGIQKFGWHSFRHTYKQLLEDRNVPQFVVQRLMRHASYKTTQKYGSGVSLELLREGQLRAAETHSQPELVVKKKRWA